jgi:hypothetical protein
VAERKRKPRTAAQKAAAAKKARERRARRSAPARRNGRPPKIEQIREFQRDGKTERVTVGDLVLRQVRTGVPQKYAAEAAGVDQATVARWVQRGGEALILAGGEVDDVPEKERVYASFVNDLMRARGTSVALVANALFESARRGNVRAQIEYLRAQAPDEFKKRIGVELEGGDRKPPPLVPEDQAQYRRAWAAAFGEYLPEFDPGELAPPDERDLDEEEVEAP